MNMPYVCAWQGNCDRRSLVLVIDVNLLKCYYLSIASVCLSTAYANTSVLSIQNALYPILKERLIAFQ